jgi:hypothetical protein
VEFLRAAVTDPEHQELLARALIMAQDTAMRDKRRALGRALASAAADTGTNVDDGLPFIRVLADLDPPHIRCLRIMAAGPSHLDAINRQRLAIDEPPGCRPGYGMTHCDQRSACSRGQFAHIADSARPSRCPAGALKACRSSRSGRPDHERSRWRARVGPDRLLRTVRVPGRPLLGR